MTTRAWLVTAGLAACLGLGFSDCRHASSPRKDARGKSDYENQRVQMVEAQIRARGIQSSAVLEAIARVPRHEFIPAGMRDYAYSDTPLPIGEGQTISQPYIVALMTELADPRPNQRILEVGTGSGYQAAILGELAAEVYTIEIVVPLAERARETLERLGYKNVVVRKGDGYRGWPEKAPFDSILVTAAAGKVPQPLLDQLVEGGKLIMPVGEVGTVQSLTVITRESGKFVREEVLPVRFVPLTGEAQKTR